MNPFEEEEEDNYVSPTQETVDNNPFAPDVREERRGISPAKESTNPFGDDDDEDLGENNPFADKFEDSSSSDKQKKKKTAPTPPSKGKKPSVADILKESSPPPNSERRSSDSVPKRQENVVSNVTKEKVNAENAHRHEKKSKSPPVHNGPAGDSEKQGKEKHHR